MDEPVPVEPKRSADGVETEPGAVTPVGPAGPPPASPVPTPDRIQSPAVPRLNRPSPRAILTIGSALLLIAVLYLSRAALGPFVVGLVLAYLLDLPVERMARRGVPRWLAVLVVYAIVVVVGAQALLITL